MYGHSKLVQSRALGAGPVNSETGCTHVDAMCKQLTAVEPLGACDLPSCSARKRGRSVQLGAIYRYPIKGLRGLSLSTASLVTGRGIEFDRFLGISNGHSVLTNWDWSPCQSFVRMTQNANLPLFGIAFDEHSLHVAIGAPDGQNVRINLGDSDSILNANSHLAEWFPSGKLQAPQLHRRDRDLGWWDCHDAPLSIISLETVRVLAQKAGHEIDPLQFRGNLYVDGLPAWQEFQWIGQRLFIGEAELEILRPIERCKAISMHPTTGEVTLNVPAVLAGGEGHLFLGVYAKVVKAGQVRVGDELRWCGKNVELVRAHTLNRDVPEPNKWPRWVKVVRKIAECDGVNSFWLSDPLSGILPVAKAGQHLRVHLHTQNDAPMWRSYTLSAIGGDVVRLSIKNEGHSGSVSRVMAEEINVGDQVLISGPFGSFHLGEPSHRPLILVSAGIGITPCASMLKALARRTDSDRLVYVLHGARNGSSIALWNEVCSRVESLPAAQARIFLSQASDTDMLRLNSVKGRITASAFDDLPIGDAEIYICGPGTFAADVRKWLVLAGARRENIFSEAFASPSASRSPLRSPQLSGPFSVHFEASGVVQVWKPTDGTLLELAEGAGLILPANCRAGVCGACRIQVREGRATHLVDPPFPLGPQEILTCCAVPTSDMTLTC